MHLAMPKGSKASKNYGVGTQLKVTVGTSKSGACLAGGLINYRAEYVGPEKTTGEILSWHAEEK